MRAHNAQRQPRQTGVGDIKDGSVGIVSIRPRAHVVESLHAVGLHVGRVGRYVVPMIIKVTS